MDVQIEGLCICNLVPTAFPAMVGVPMELENGQPISGQFGHHVRASRSHRAVRKPRTPQQCSLGPR